MKASLIHSDSEEVDIIISTTVPVSQIVGNYTLCIVSNENGAFGAATTGYGFDLDRTVARKKALFEHLEREASYADLSTSLESVRLEPEFLASGLADSFFDNKLSDNNKFFGCMFYSHRHARGVNIPLYAKPTKQGNTEIIFPISSSGCASHVNDRLAKQSSILEVVERDAFFTSWYGNISSKCCNNIAIVEDIFENTPFDNWNSIKIYRLPTSFNCYVYATVLINNSDGVLIGLGAALDNDTALRKSSMEALYFFNWPNIFGQKSSTVSHFPVINDFDDHLYFFWFCGKQSYSQLECGGEFLFNDYERNFSYHDLISSINADHYLFYRKLKTNCSVKHSVYRSFISHTINQHTRYDAHWNLDFMKTRFAGFAQLWPVLGLHPFT